MVSQSIYITHPEDMWVVCYDNLKSDVEVDRSCLWTSEFFNLTLTEASAERF